MFGSLKLWWQLVRLGVRSLFSHKLRSALTVLGMVFGVASVISILAIGEGASHEVQEQLRRLGPDRILLKSRQPQDERGGTRAEYGLKLVDLDRIQSLVPDLRSIAASYELEKDAHEGPLAVRAPLVCTTPSFLDIHRLEISRGRFLSSPDLESQANVVVLGATIARKLFGARDPVGLQLKLGSGRYRIVGLLKPRGDATATIHDPADSIFLPLTTGKLRLDKVIRIVSAGGKRYELVELHQIGMRVNNLDSIEQQASMLRQLLKIEHPTMDDVEVVVPFELLRQAERTKRVFSWVLGSIAGISLLVGGIGIMNIMLATVTERTREIGVRRALGAKRAHVMLQFLVETVALSVSGGILGLALGLLLPALVEWAADMKTIVTAQSLILAMGISVVTGILFGMYPARRAAIMDPIDALRYGG